MHRYSAVWKIAMKRKWGIWSHVDGVSWRLYIHLPLFNWHVRVSVLISLASCGGGYGIGVVVQITRLLYHGVITYQYQSKLTKWSRFKITLPLYLTLGCPKPEKCLDSNLGTLTLIKSQNISPLQPVLMVPTMIVSLSIVVAWLILMVILITLRRNLPGINSHKRHWNKGRTHDIPFPEIPFITRCFREIIYHTESISHRL